MAQPAPNPAPPAVDATIRSKVSIGLAEALGGRDPPTSDEEVNALTSLAEEIESAMLEKYGGTGKDYRSKYRTLLFNLKDDKNPMLGKRVRARELSIEKLITLDAKELASEEVKMTRAESQERYFAQRAALDGEKLVGWQAGTSGMLSTHKNTEANKLGTRDAEQQAAAGAAGAEEAMRDAMTLPPGYWDDPTGEGAPAHDDGGSHSTPVPDEVVGEEDDADAAPFPPSKLEHVLFEDEDEPLGASDDELPAEPPAKVQRLAASARGAPTIATGSAVAGAQALGAKSPGTPRAAPRTNVQRALLNAGSLLPPECDDVIADPARLSAVIRQALAVRDRFSAEEGAAESNK